MAALLTALAWVALPAAAVAGSGIGASSLASAAATGGGSAVSLGSLVVPGVQALDGGQQELDAEGARRTSPRAFAARLASRTAYEHLDAAQAAALAGRAFPKLVDERDGGLPPLPTGTSVVGYPTDHAARVALPGHRHGVVESLEPIALETAPGHRAPIDLGLRQSGGVFEPVRPVVVIRIPQRLGAGIGLGRTGVSLTPLSAGGSALAGSPGQIDGAGVIYANTLADADTLVKPSTLGFSAETLLRSANSPRELYFRVGMPAGARLAPATGGGVDVLAGHAKLASVSAPSAHDAEGRDVPVAMSAAGDILTVRVAPFAGRYLLPIAVDPTVTDTQFQNELHYGINLLTEWHFEHNGAAFSAPEFPEGGSWTETLSGTHSAGEWGALSYTTTGASQITEAHIEGHRSTVGANVASDVILAAPKPPPSNLEAYTPLVSEEKGGTVCAPSLKCEGVVSGEAPEENHNSAAFNQQVLGAGAAATSTVTGATVTILQTEGPELYFNTTSATIYNERTGEYIPNVLYGSGGWLGPHYGAFEAYTKDPGMGVSLFRMSGSHWDDQENNLENGKCRGLQCPAYVHGWQIYNDGLADGEDELEAFSQDSASLYQMVFKKIKVDATPPHNIKLSGLQNGDELPLGEPHLKVEATDGEGTTHSSGVKSIKLKIDGVAVPSTAASCPEGPCTASTEATLIARDYTSGPHSVIVTATDNANNIVQEEFTFVVHGAAPATVGPGSVDPSTGELTLSGSDLSLGGTSGVSRTYRSREPGAGGEGPFGPQWAVNLGDEGLVVAANGDATLNASSGGGATFVRNEKGEYESPKGDGNLKLEAKEAEPGKGIGEYVLSDAKAGAKTKFQQPAAQQITPTFAEEFGPAAQLAQPQDDAVDAAGDVWVTSYKNDLLEKFSATGTLLATYGSAGTAGGQFAGPWGVAIDPRNGDIYVSDQGGNRVEELSPSGAFIRTYGWGVGDGKPEFERCTASCRAGVAGSGPGQFSVMAGLAVDSSGNVWVVDYGNSRVEEFNEKGEYQKAIGSAGTGSEQFEGPLNLAISGADLYITDNRNNRIQEFSTTGAHVGSFGKSGSGNGEFSGPYGITADVHTGDLYVTELGNKRVQELTSSGSFITKFGVSGTGPGQFTSPVGVAVNALGYVYVVDNGSYYVDEWARPRWVPAEVGGPLAGSATTYAYTTVESEGRTLLEPAEELAPIPAGVSSCTPLARGCRALTFEYASSTTASGEGESQWGAYKGRLAKVYFTAWDPAKGAMSAPIAVVQYVYDAKGRLRAEWDPRVTPKPLKTIYGYDAEGHVTAVSGRGQQPWLIHYGTIPGDANMGRALSVTRPPASTALPAAVAPVSTTAPALSTTHPAEGDTLSVSEGSWSNTPLAYGYQWERCSTNFEVRTCTAITGATNQTYSPIAADRNKELVVVVTATNAGGSASVESNLSHGVQQVGYWKKESEFGGTGEGSGQFKDPWGIATAESEPDVYVVDSGNGRIEKFSSAGVFQSSFGKKGSGSEQFSAPEGLASRGEYVYVADSGNSRLASVRTSFTSGYKNLGISTTPGWLGEGEVYGTSSEEYELKPFLFDSNHGTDMIEMYAINATGVGSKRKSFGGKGTGTGKFEGAAGVVESSEHNVYVVDEGGDRVEEFNDEEQYVGQFGEKGSGNGQFLAPKGIAEYEGDLYVVDSGNNRVQEFNLQGEYVAQFSVAAGAQGIALGNNSGSEVFMFVTNGTTNKIERWLKTTTPIPVPAPPSPGKLSLTTLEYGVPLSGSESSHLPNLTKGEVETWGQTAQNDPVEGMAIFPPDEPQGWPASGYERATIRYWSSRGQIVNTYAPTGGVATSEYNEDNEVTRTLSADNRATALKAGCKSLEKHECASAELAEKLDTKTEYNAEGTQTLKVLGPEHLVKLSSGAEVQARNVTHDYYNEGAKEAEEITHETYDLLTKTTDAALLSGGKEEDVRETIDSYGGQGDLGWTLRQPTSVTTDPSGLDLTTTTVYDPATGNVLESRSPASAGKESPPLVYSSQFGHEGSGEGLFKGAMSDATDAQGNVWVTRSSEARLQEFNAEGKLLRYLGGEGSGELQFKSPFGVAINQSTGNVYVVDSGNNRIEELSSEGKYVRAFGTEGTGKEQLKAPWGIAIDPSGNVWVTDAGNNRIKELSSTGTLIAAYGWGVLDGKSELEKCTTTCRAGLSGSGSGQFSTPRGIAVQGNTVYVAEYGNNRVQELSIAGTYLGQWGVKGAGNGQLNRPYGLALDPVSGDVYVADYENDRVSEFSPTGDWIRNVGSYGGGAGQLSGPEGVAVASSGVLWVADDGNHRMESWALQSSSTPRPGDEAAHDMQTIYYTAAANVDHPECGEHAEWAGLVCQGRPLAQTGLAGLPEQPVTTVVYNIWDTPETITEKFGSTTRTKTETFDAAGRALTSEVTSSPATDTALPKVTNEYNETTGALDKQGATIGGEAKASTSSNNSLGQLTEYTDASGNVAKYVYEEGDDDRLLEASQGKGTEGAGTQTYSYDPTTGFLTKLVDSAQPGMTFTATYDAEGSMLSETYPNGMTADYTYGSLGTATGIEYVKNVDCASKCPETWFSDTDVPSIHGETAAQSSTLAKELYTYDKAGRLIQAQETPAGKDCTTRLYSYDEDSNRTAQTTRESTSETCATEGGAVQTHAYDSSDRLIDTGVEYEVFGNATKLPAVDAGEHALSSTYYVDGQVASQEQNGKTIAYTYDPAGRTMETTTSEKTATVDHYNGPEEALAWASEGAGKWSRNIPGIDRSLDAIQKSGAAPELELHDLSGDIVGSVGYAETETKLLSKYNSTEFGVPSTSNPPKYGWLGAEGVASELPSSGVSTEGGSSYVPEVGRPLQTSPIASPGAFPNGTATVGVIYSASVDLGSGELKMISIEERAARESAKQAETEEHEKMGECVGSCAQAPEEPLGGGGGGEGGGGGGDGMGDGIVVLPKICNGPDGEIYVCGESETKQGKQHRSGESEDNLQGWDCVLSYGIVWTNGQIHLDGDLTCNVEIRSYNINGYAAYGYERDASYVKPKFPKEEEEGLSYNVHFNMSFKHFRGHVNETWTEVCWNASSRYGWASGCTEPLVG